MCDYLYKKSMSSTKQKPIIMTEKSFPSLGAAVTPVVKLDYKKMVSKEPAKATDLKKVHAVIKKILPSSNVVTHSYEDFGEDYDGPDEWELEEEQRRFEFNADLPSGRRG